MNRLRAVGRSVGAAASGRLGAMAADAGLDIALVKVWRGLGAVALLGASFGAMQGGVIGGGVGAAAGIGAALMALRCNRHRRQRAIEAQLPGFLEAIARGLRTGSQLGPATVSAASSAPAPLRHEVAPLAVELGRGFRSADAFDRWCRRCPARGVGLAAAAMAFAATAGGARARAIDGVAATLRDRAALEAEVRSLTAQARVSAMMIAALPLGFMLMSAGVSDDSAGFLFTTRLGLAILTCGLSLDVIGGLWMRHIVNSRH
ncbi:MAG: type II secretion system F family protein [bacterium]|nr:type II secretion system F family protein [bacterium]